MNLLEGLNPEQEKAVLHTEGPLLVLQEQVPENQEVLTHGNCLFNRGKRCMPLEYTGYNIYK